MWDVMEEDKFFLSLMHHSKLTEITRSDRDIAMSL